MKRLEPGETLIERIEKLEAENERLRADVEDWKEETRKLGVVIHDLRADVAELSRVLNGIANRGDFADKVLEKRRALLLKDGEAPNAQTQNRETPAK